MSARPRLLVDVVTDFVCPWCFVGLHSFLHARSALATDFEVIARFRAYELNPGTPPEGLDRNAYYERKFPDAARREMMRAHLIEAAMAAGADFDPALPTRIPNTIRAHQVMRWAHFEGRQEDFARAVYAAHWKDGADIGEIGALTEAAGAAGMDKASVAARLDLCEDEEAVRAEAAAFRQAGVSGVPTFIVNERVGFSGALPPGDLARALRQVAEQSDAGQ